MAGRKLQRPVHLALDFDATLTKRDTIELMREIPLHRNKRLGYEAFPVPDWTTMGDAYMQDYERHKKAYEPIKAHQRSAARTFADQARAYSDKLARKRVVEEQSMKRLEDWDFFRGVKREDIHSAVATVLNDGRLEMCDHWTELFALFASTASGTGPPMGSGVSIISLNWSEAFIRNCLRHSVGIEAESRQAIHDMIEDRLQVYASEIDGLDDPEGSSGKMLAGVLSSADKLRHLPPASRKKTTLHSWRTPKAVASYLVYVGDSSTDFDALMAGDTGIWLCPARDLEAASKKCEECFNPLKLRLRHVRDIEQGEDIEADQLVWAQDFKQIIDFLLRLAP